MAHSRGMSQYLSKQCWYPREGEGQRCRLCGPVKVAYADGLCCPGKAGLLGEEISAGQGQCRGMTDKNEMVDEMWAKSGGMAKQQGGGPDFAAIALQGLVDEGSACWIKSGDPVVDDQQAWIAGKEHGQGDQCPLLMAEVADFHSSAQAEFRHEGVKMIIAPVGITAAEKESCLADGHHLVNALVVLQHPNLLANIHGQIVDGRATDQKLSGSGTASAGQQFKQRRLAEAVLGGEYGQPAMGDGEVEMLAKGLRLKNQGQINGADAGRGLPRGGNRWHGKRVDTAGREIGAIGLRGVRLRVHGLLWCAVAIARRDYVSFSSK